MTQHPKTAKKAVVLLSGGLDSATTLAMAQAEGYACYALSFRYGQRHEGELLAARRVAKALGVVEHKIASIDLRLFGGSALTADMEVPKDRPDDAISTGIPITYVPARNTIFLSYALGWAEVLGAFDLFIGVNAVDYSGYPDCRPAFIHAFTQLANLATAAGTGGAEHIHAGRFTVHAPLIDLTKAEIIRRGMALGVPYGETLSCYDPIGERQPCGHCDACQLRAKGFAEAGFPDPAL
jgi:7-cyano-7-deazaguanine synthase